MTICAPMSVQPSGRSLPKRTSRSQTAPWAPVAVERSFIARDPLEELLSRSPKPGICGPKQIDTNHGWWRKSLSFQERPDFGHHAQGHTLCLAPAANRNERDALDRLLREVSAWDLSLPDDPQQRPLRFELQPS
jgi:hypothetical protein